MVPVAIAQAPSIEVSIQQALRHLDIDHLIRGKQVAIKPNETWADADDKTAVTQADTLRSVIRHVRRFGPAGVVVTGGSGAADTAEVMKVSGMMDVIEEEGASFFDHNKPPFVSVDLEYAPQADVDGPQKSVMVNPRILQYDTLIALNQLKVHSVATVTMALKNIAMSFPATDYYGHPRHKEYHKHDFFEDMHSFIAAMAKRFHIDLAITVGHPAMVGKGPIGGTAFETGLTIASTDALAADVVGAKLLGFGLQAVRHLWEAAKLGVGEGDLHNMSMPGLSLDDAIAAFTAAVYGQRIGAV